MGAYGKDRKTLVKVNEPLRIGDSKVYLTAHGYAPVVTVRNGRGDVVFHDAVPMLPLDPNVTSQGAIKVMDGYRNGQGQPEQLASPASSCRPSRARARARCSRSSPRSTSPCSR